jgi:cytoskeletal protein RodZ
MNYCPYCAAQITKPSKVCPNCKKVLDFELLNEIYMSGKRSEPNRKLLKQKWFKEHKHIIVPIITMLVGIFVGGIISYLYAQADFVTQRKNYRSQISELQQTIAAKDSAVSNSSDEFQKQLSVKNDIIGVLSEQKKILISIASFTRRLARNSVITPNSVDESDYYKRNVTYLKSQFDKQEEKLAETAFETGEASDVITIPQIFEE